MEEAREGEREGGLGGRGEVRGRRKRGGREDEYGGEGGRTSKEGREGGVGGEGEGRGGGGINGSGSSIKHCRPNTTYIPCLYCACPTLYLEPGTIVGRDVAISDRISIQ